MARFRRMRSRYKGRFRGKTGIFGRVLRSLTSPVGLILLGGGMFLPFLLGGKVKDKIAELSSKIKGGAA